MNTRAFLAAFVLAMWWGCQCGPPQATGCRELGCESGQTCDAVTNRCKFEATDGGGGSSGDGGTQTDGGTALCAPTCSGATPVCRGGGQCVQCETNAHCSGFTPACESVSGSCVACMIPDDCPVPGSACDTSTHTCTVGGTGGGSGGGTSGTGGSGGVGGGAGGSSGTPVFDDAGMTSRCLPFDAGTATSCTSECSRGYVCINHQCYLRGSTGPVQVTLRWNQPEDLDLHLVEPLTDGGTCEIYYANPGVNPNLGPPPFPNPFPIPQCGAKAWLDLDSNANCEIDNVNVENIIYSPTVTPTRGNYIVRVVYYAHCSADHAIPFEVEVRANGVTRWYCGQFQPNEANGGNEGAGVTMTTFSLL